MYFQPSDVQSRQINKKKSSLGPGVSHDRRTPDYKFILCLEGKRSNKSEMGDVVKLTCRYAFSKFETWFMNTLVGQKHYVEIKDDYSDLGGTYDILY